MDWDEGTTLKRQDAVSLLREIMTACLSFCAAQAVSLTESNEGNWELSVFWVPDALDGDCLDKIVAARNLEVISTNGRLVFRSQQKPD